MTLCGAAAKGVPYTQLCKHSLDYHWTRRSTQYQDLCFSEPQAIRHKRNSVSCTGKPRPREASATSVGTGTSGTGTQAVWPLVQRRVLGGGCCWVASLDTCPSSTLPTLALWSPLRSQQSVWRSLRSCFSDFPFVTASSIFARTCICPARLYVCRVPRAAGIRGRKGDPHI